MSKLIQSTLYEFDLKNEIMSKRENVSTLYDATKYKRRKEPNQEREETTESLPHEAPFLAAESGVSAL